MSLSSKLASNIESSNELYVDFLVLVEGIQVPWSSVSVSYGINGNATCSVVLPASNIIRDLPAYTKIHVFFRDLLPNENNEHEWCLLFDGEKSSWNYVTNESGASISLNGIHTTMLLNTMQLLSLDMHQAMYFRQPMLAGKACIPSASGKNTVRSSIMQSLMSAENRGKYKSMVDIVWALCRAIVESTSATSTGKYYMEKMGNSAKGYKTLRRFYGVSDAAKGATVAAPGFQPSGAQTTTPTQPYTPGTFGDPDLGELADGNWHAKQYGSPYQGRSDLYVKDGVEMNGVTQSTKDATVKLAETWNAKHPGDALLITDGYRYNGDGGHGAGLKVDICTPGIASDLSKRSEFIETATKNGFVVLNEYNYKNRRDGNKDLTEQNGHIDLKYVGG